MDEEPTMPFLLEVAIKVTLVLVIPGLLIAAAVVFFGGPEYRQHLILATVAAMTAGFLGGCSVFAGLGPPVGRWPLVKRWLVKRWLLTRRRSIS